MRVPHSLKALGSSRRRQHRGDRRDEKVPRRVSNCKPFAKKFYVYYLKLELPS